MSGTGAPDQEPTRAASLARGDWIRALAAMQRLAARPEPTLLALLEAEAHAADSPALIGRSVSLSYGDLTTRSRRYAAWALAQGIGEGEVVGLLAANAPDYVVIWLGLTAIGVVVALLNTDLAAAALTHGLETAGVQHLLYDARHAAVAQKTLALAPGVQGVALDGLALPAPADRLRQPRRENTALLIYTSGTTGLPKATRITHARILEWSLWFAAMMEASPADRLYDCLPMYHSVGGVVAVGAMLVAGGAVVVRERFSVRVFWDDVAAEGCTIVQYIGELCRYLLQAPGEAPPHRIRLFCGNGLAAAVWSPFQRRFSIPRILEFYAATEGGVSLYNCEGKPGAIGRIPPFLAHRFPVALIRCDPETGAVLRGADGHCLPAAIDEPGEAIGARHFDGYTDDAASERKRLNDVFESGDHWFRSGDLMRRDQAGYVYFLDRLGDTFRWKGHNVSTTEIAATIAACPGVLDAVVYGVAVPGAEGRAGMAAIVPREDFRLAELHAHLAATPAYARPLYIRLCKAIAATGTFKPRKVRFAEEGYADSTDPVWRDDGTTYVPLKP